MADNYVIGIDLGGTKISGAVADFDGNIVSQYTIPTKAEEGEEAVLQRIILVIEKVIEESKVAKDKIVTIGIGSPGPLDAKEGKIITTPNLPFRNFNLVKPLKDKFNIHVYLDNDANVAAMGEYIFGAGKGTSNMIFVTVSTGIGGGAILNGKIYRGNTSNALEIGHMTLEKDGPRCNCGNYGCAEALASGTAIGRLAKEEITKGVKTSLTTYENVTSYEVFKEAEKGDAVAKAVLDKALNYLGICIANIIASFDPEMVIIGGGVSKGGDIVFKKVQEVVNKRCFKSMAESTKIVPAGLGTNAGLMGAVALAIMESK
ncbi:ROK family protein [Clostridium thermopalmarium]|uniref:Glucokinase n=1 Tax=Clostridium thermopalmarium DSM 5974 TaxID=1121340 RepID=A0A2T0AV09_9CLOT|nr:ROK family protein [Clostridium thermopalmarium]PRR74390.1 Glucokinase [Clostridium thermopalmarium DSM 5974]PVZ21663.1 glucokinase [Clostridium thermopalmarium DSM 5974]